MAALVVPNSLLVTIKGDFLGEDWANVYGVTHDGAFLLDQSVVDDIADQFNTLYNNLSGAMSISCVARECVISDLRTATSPAWDAAFLDVEGASTAIPLGPSIAMCVTHTTGLRGKSYRGRTYLTGAVTTAVASDGRLSTGIQDLITGSFETLRTNLAGVTGGPFEFAVVSRKLLLATPIVESTMDGELDHQDRRKRA